MSDVSSLGRIDPAVRERRALMPWRLLLLAGWICAVVGYHGPWVDHTAAGLILTGVDMAEFVKFLPQVMDGTLVVLRQLFYLPILATVVSIALLVGAPRLNYPWLVRIALLGLAFLFSLQFLPPAWSPASLVTAEFRLQAVAMFACWFALAGFWLWGEMPLRLTGLLSAGLSLLAVVLPGWQYLAVKPFIDSVYGSPPPIGWGFWLCLVGLGAVAAATALLALQRYRAAARF